MNITKVIVSKLDGILDNVKIENWIKPLEIIKDNNNYFIKAPNSFSLDIVEKRFLKIIQTILECEYGKINQIKLSVIDKSDNCNEKAIQDIISKIKEMYKL